MASIDNVCDIGGCYGSTDWMQDKAPHGTLIRIEANDKSLYEYRLNVCEWHANFIRAATEISRTVDT